MAGRELDGYGILVTGGGTGIGRACAARLAADGAAVTICGRTESRLKQVVDGAHHLRAGPDFRPYTGLSDDQMLGRSS
jgi:short-subunit dehydrogenase involved in D-alanine esterification of teichoic acids